MSDEEDVRQAVRAHLQELRDVSASGTNEVSIRGVTAILQRQFPLWSFETLTTLIKEESAKLGFVPLRD